MNRKLLGILALALLVRVFTFAGYVAQPDEIVYVEMVQEVLGGTWPRYEGEDLLQEMVFPTRIGYIAVNTALVALLGVSDLSFTLYPLLSSLGTVVVVFLLGRRWLGARGGLWAAFFYALFPLDIIYSTKVFGDPALAFLCALAVLLFFQAQDRPTRGARALTFFAAGCVVGFAYLHKVTAGYTAIFFALIGLVDMVRNRRVMGRYVALALGFGLLFCVEMGFQLRVNQDPLYRWNVFIKQAESLQLRAALHAEERVYGWKDDLKRLCWTFPLRSLFSLRLGFAYWFIFPAVAACLLQRRRDLWAPLLWWVLLALLINLSTWGGGRLPFYVRQLCPLTVPGVILVAAAFLRMEAWSASRAAGLRKALGYLPAGAAAFCLAAGVGLWAFQDTLLPILVRLYASNRIVVSDALVAWFFSFYSRHLITSALAAACLFAVLYFLGRRWDRAPSRAWVGGVLVATLAGFFALSSISSAYVVNRGMPSFGLEKDAWRVLRELPPATVYADWYTKKKLDFYMRFKDPDRVVDLRAADLESLRDGYLVYNAFRRDLEKGFRDVLPDYRTDHPYLYPYDEVDAARRADWVLLENVREGQILIYRLPPREVP